MNTTPDHILYEMSYENMVMYSAATPSYDDERDDWDEGIDANDPNNFKNKNEEVFVR